MTDRDDAPERTPEERRADHAAIDRLADELLPALVAKLGASGLGELDVREGRWRVRLRMPGDGRAARRPAGPGRSTSRLDGHAAAVGHPGPLPGGQPAPPAVPSMPAGSLPAGGSTGRALGRAGSEGTAGAADAGSGPNRAVATSPAVGFFQPRAGLAAGARVRAGDPIGAIDVLGVPHEVVAPTDGIVGATVVAAGDPVEYGQPLLEIELLAPAAAAGAGRAEGAENAAEAGPATPAAGTVAAAPGPAEGA